MLEKSRKLLRCWLSADSSIGNPGVQDSNRLCFLSIELNCFQTVLTQEALSVKKPLRPQLTSDV
jgi:hypothetical protein